MLNKTDSAKSGDAPVETSLISSSSKTDNAVQLSSNQMTRGNSGNVSSNRLMARFKQLSLSTKTTVLAIAMTTVPVLVIGVGAYLAASQSMRNKVFDLQQAQTKAFADKVNRFMFERYGDIQVIANLPIIKSSGAGSAQKRAVLNDYVNTYKVYDGIGIFNLNGDAIVQSQGTNFSNQGNFQYFQNAQNSNDAVIGKPNNSSSIYTAAAIRNPNSGNITSVVVARMPLESLGNVVQNYATASAQEYHVVDAQNNIFLSAEKEDIGKSLAEEYPQVSQKADVKQVFTGVVKGKNNS
ncbi:MAG: cache domain-containing protein, partial [Cyanobacteria bacterium J06649_11]